MFDAKNLFGIQWSSGTYSGFVGFVPLAPVNGIYTIENVSAYAYADTFRVISTYPVAGSSSYKFKRNYQSGGYCRSSIYAATASSTSDYLFLVAPDARPNNFTSTTFTGTQYDISPVQCSTNFNVVAYNSLTPFKYPQGDLSVTFQDGFVYSSTCSNMRIVRCIGEIPTDALIVRNQTVALTSFSGSIVAILEGGVVLVDSSTRYYGAYVILNGGTLVLLNVESRVSAVVIQTGGTIIGTNCNFADSNSH